MTRSVNPRVDFDRLPIGPCRGKDRRWPFIGAGMMFALCTAMPRWSVGDESAVHFAREIRPLLSDACFTCHGADAAQRQADLRLDTRAGLFEKRDVRSVVTPGQPEESELYRRITSSDPDLRMPPADTGRVLSPAEIGLLRRWIDAGAEWEPHWALVPPKIPPLPPIEDRDWPRSPLDRFILSRLEEERLQPSPATDRATLLRRVTLDLTGLPPTIDELDAFEGDRRPGAYERAVDRILASPHYGERMSTIWLDAARYSDTDGYQDDEPRSMWRWRDWVIDAFNDNRPYDQFTREQIAGDLLPGALPEQVLATGFHRNNRTNGEGGSIEEEFRVEYVADRIVTFSTVWLGLTLECARCHDHKYDAISQRDFYQLFAFFNNIPEPAIYRRSAPPTVVVPPRGLQRELDRIDVQLAGLGAESPQAKTLQGRKELLLKKVPATMCLQEGPARETFMLVRGQYNRPGERVSPGVPASLDVAWRSEWPTNRLGLAEWLLDPAHPLTARVAVNRIWHLHFGRGLVESLEDFGVQGESPSHPKLLDWLAATYVRLGWDTKALQRMIVTSATYRQTSKTTAASIERDPNNRLLARGTRQRLPAEMVRDVALAASGLMVPTIGGPPVKPYQPEGIWQELAGGSSGAYNDGYQIDPGAGRYRRALYHFWRRTIPPPSMTLFDAPDREVCSVRRPTTSTPLQALALWNDLTFVAAAQQLARRMMHEGGDHPQERIRFGFRAATGRCPSPEETDILIKGLQDYQAVFRADPDSALKLTAHPPQGQPIEWAAYTALASVILNLDETITRE